MQFKTTSLSLGLIISILSFSAIADEPSNPNYGLSFSSSNQLTMRKPLNESTMIYGGIGLAGYEYEGHDNSTGNNSSLTLGARDYLSKDRLSKFINLELTRGITSYSGNTPDYQNMYTTANITYGIEYFLASNFSIEGSAGVGINWQEYTYPTYSYTYRNNSFPAARLALTYYW